MVVAPGQRSQSGRLPFEVVAYRPTVSFPGPLSFRVSAVQLSVGVIPVLLRLETYRHDCSARLRRD